ncbi:hypothetical protein [Sinorhizobium meliloti]|uniref:hypothetical protein n=1 Tax=Rhizobium meliloti TaxID=382 RepID=UPI0037047D75
MKTKGWLRVDLSQLGYEVVEDMRHLSAVEMLRTPGMGRHDYRKIAHSMGRELYPEMKEVDDHASRDCRAAAAMEGAGPIKPSQLREHVDLRNGGRPFGTMHLKQLHLNVQASIGCHANGVVEDPH